MNQTTKDTKNLYQRIAAITAAIGAISKTGKNTAQNYDFIEQAMVVATLRPLMAEHGVVIIPETVDKTIERFETVKKDKYGERTSSTYHVNVMSRYHVINADNPEDRFTAEWSGEALDMSDKATNKAMTASEKTFLMKLFKISDKEDADAETIEMPSQTQKAMAEQKTLVDTVNSIMVAPDAPRTLKSLARLRHLSKNMGLDPALVEERIKTLKTEGAVLEAIKKLEEEM